MATTTADGARGVLKEVQNALADGGEELTVTRALGGWKAGGRIERDFAAAKEAFSKTKFVYLEMSTKHEFVTEIVNGGGCEDQKVDVHQYPRDDRSAAGARRGLPLLPRLQSATFRAWQTRAILIAKKAVRTAPRRVLVPDHGGR